MGLEVAHRALQSHLLAHPPDPQEQLLQVERLGDVVGRPLLHGLHRRLHRPVGGDQDEGDLGIHGLDPAQQLDPRHARHLEVADHQVHPRVLHAAERLGPAAGQEDLVPLLLQEAADELALRRLVIHDQDTEGIHQKPPRSQPSRHSPIRNTRRSGLWFPSMTDRQ